MLGGSAKGKKMVCLQTCSFTNYGMTVFPLSKHMQK